MKSLTCNKLSHCLFDFDCEDLKVYESETYNLDVFELKDMLFASEDESEATSHDSKDFRLKSLVSLQRHEMNVSWKPFDNLNRGSEFMRILFKPESQTLWGFH